MATEHPAVERDDATLLADHVAGDQHAFGILFARHRERLWAVALRTTGDPELAADGLQEGMISAFRRAETFRGDARVTTWLHRIVVNACLDLLRRRSSRRSDPLPDDLDETDRGSLPTSDEGADPADLQVRRERADAVHAALAQLAPEQRAAVVLVDMEGYAVAEVAAILDCAVGTVKSRCARARARLALLLPDLLDDAPEETGTIGGPGAGNRPTSADVSTTTPRGPPAAPLTATD